MMASIFKFIDGHKTHMGIVAQAALQIATLNGWLDPANPVTQSIIMGVWGWLGISLKHSWDKKNT